MDLINRRKNEAIEWARHVLEHKDDYVIFDTETTGLKASDVIIHFAVMDLDGNMLIDTMVKPMSKRRMSQEATYIHGMTMKDLKGAPLFEDVVRQFEPIAANKKLLSYNARFHGEMFVQTYYNEGVSGAPLNLNCFDVKDYYEKFTGLDRVALPGRKNTGEGDCRATLAVIQKMSAAEVTPMPSRPAESAFSMRNVAGFGLLLIGAVIVFSGWYLIGFLGVIGGIAMILKSSK